MYGCTITTFSRIQIVLLEFDHLKIKSHRFEYFDLRCFDTITYNKIGLLVYVMKKLTNFNPELF